MALTLKEMKMAFTRFNNGLNFVDLSKVARIQPPSEWPMGTMQNVTFTTETGYSFSISMNETQFAALSLPVA